MSYAKQNPSGLASNIPMGGQKGKESSRFYSNNFSLLSPIRNTGDTPDPPVISPDSGDYTNDVEVTITEGTSGVPIYYTTNGVDPTPADTLYTGPFTISPSLSAAVVIKAVAIEGGINYSTVASKTYNITVYVHATGGTRTEDGDYDIYTFLNSGTWTVTRGAGNVWYLVIGGGGGGPGAQDSLGGGGGSGRWRSNDAYDYAVTLGDYSVIVGAGGAGGAAGRNNGSPGSDSSFDSIVAEGGGLGGTVNSDGGSGGSGGGGGQSLSRATAGGASLGTFGNAGGGVNSPNKSAGAGGGGAGAAAATVTVNNVATNGGAGKASTITGASVIYAGGGGGSGYAVAGIGGTGGGGNGDLYTAPAGSAGEANKGAGGGAGGANPSVPGYAGGKGIVIIRVRAR